MNKLFQFLWLCVIRPNVRRKTGQGWGLIGYSSRIAWQLRLAVFFGRYLGAWPRGLLYGDSNAEFSETWRLMIRFPFVMVNIGIAGSRADSWTEFFETERGAQCYAMIRELMAHDCVIFQNVGGNNVLQGRMGEARGALTELQRLFPSQWAFNLPPIHLSILAIIGYDPVQTAKDVSAMNKLISEASGRKIIDVFTQFMDPLTGAGFVLPYVRRGRATVLSVTGFDGIHFSEEARRVIIAEITAIIRVET